MTFKALWATKPGNSIVIELKELNDEQLMLGDVTIAVEYSTVNYKDGLAISGRAPIIQAFPLIPGIDLAGIVEASSNSAFQTGDRVVVNGWALSQTHHGGYAQRARVCSEWLVKLPDTFSTKQAMAIGTAGYTAMLSVLALEQGGITPDKGDILVTGASGGVGSIAIALLSKLGYRVLASTGRLAEAAYLKSLGAAEVLDRSILSTPGAPLGTEKWAGAVDTCGGNTLVNVLAQTSYRGTVTACGLAQSMDFPASMLPFILRNITLAGIDSVNAPQQARITAWERLAQDLDLEKLGLTTQEITLQQVPEVAQQILEGKVRGRTLVNVNA
ncbi:MDR family oxidoreductase [Methylobacter sp. S3L5C]|uniref:acrylyl-CoA reductase (NADPH) n=1 Tax=Methylobacter sp. S3L5C TaxID=2839024 RepID=UPI001FABB517|nr:MDR family oxidoreductase [Methylobacter sp. S3L5C]UOA09835.1 oxidoreductase [Methylobacter sp. S3L5C]